MPTTGWSSCGARPARCSRASSIWAGAARSSPAPSATSWCAPAWPASSSSTSATRRSTSAASTGCPSRRRRRPRRRRLGESFHIGRLAVSGPDHEPLVVDWRAPVAEPFYRATGLDPQGLARRRHLAVRGRTVLGLEDEYFVDPDGRPAAAPVRRRGGRRRRRRRRAPALRRAGPRRPRRAALRARAGPHRATWATSSAPSSASRTRSSARPCRASWSSRAGRARARRRWRCTAPPTCSTRTASRSSARACSWSGRTRCSCATSSRCCPRSGETGVSLSTVSGLVPEVRVRGVDDPAVARLKGDVRMVKVLARAVRTRQRPLRHDVEIPFGAGVLRLRARATEEIVALARRRPGHAQRAPAVRRVAGAARPGRRVPGPARPRRRGDRSRRRASARRSRTTWRSGCGVSPRWPRRSTGCGPGSRRTSSCTTCSAPGRCSPPPARASSARRSVQRLYRPAQRLPRRRAVDGRRHRARSTRRAPCSARAARPGEPGPGAAEPKRRRRRRRGSGPRVSARRPLPAASPRRRRRGRDPLVRPHRGRRGAGPLAHAAAHAGAPLALGLHDRGGRHRAGHRSVGARRLGRGDPPPQPSTPAPAGRADGQLPHPGRGGGARRAGPRRGRAVDHPAPPGAPVGPRAPDRRAPAAGPLGGHAGRPGARGGGGGGARAAWPCSARP